MAENGITRIGNNFTELSAGNINNSEDSRRQRFEAIAQEFYRLGSGWAAPTGTASKATFNANATTVVSNPPTQAEVQAINDRLLATRQILKAVIDTLLGE